MEDGFRKLNLATGSTGGRELTVLVTKLFVLSLYGHGRSSCCSSKHASYVDKFIGGPRLQDLGRETLESLAAEVVEAVSYLRLVVTSRETKGLDKRVPGTSGRSRQSHDHGKCSRKEFCKSIGAHLRAATSDLSKVGGEGKDAVPARFYDVHRVHSGDERAA